MMIISSITDRYGQKAISFENNDMRYSEQCRQTYCERGAYEQQYDEHSSDLGKGGLLH